MIRSTLTSRASSVRLSETTLFAEILGAASVALASHQLCVEAYR
jgi:hypothetical protein